MSGSARPQWEKDPRRFSAFLIPLRKYTGRKKMSHRKQKHSNRSQYEIYRGFYKKAHESKYCFYCGDTAGTTDHVPALSEVYNRGIDFFRDHNINLITVSCCPTCNSVAHNRGWTTDQRAPLIYEYYKNKYDRADSGAQWTEEELEELGPCLRSAVRNLQDFSDTLTNKLAYMEDMFYDVLYLD